MPASPSSSLNVEYLGVTSTQTERDLPSIESSPPTDDSPEVIELANSGQLSADTATPEFDEPDEILPVGDMTVDYGTLGSLVGDGVVPQLKVVTFEPSLLHHSPLEYADDSCMTDVQPMSPVDHQLSNVLGDTILISRISSRTPTPVLLEVYTTDLVEIEPLSLSDHIEYLLRRPDLPADLRSHLESFTPSPPAATKPVSAFSTFTAVYALVKLQRKTKKRYQAQREAIINELGL
jgi:hypothetical protein